MGTRSVLRKMFEEINYKTRPKGRVFIFVIHNEAKRNEESLKEISYYIRMTIFLTAIQNLIIQIF